VAGDLDGLIAAAIASENRYDRDRAKDEGRNPAAVLSFFGVQPGQRVAELNAGWGYHAALLADMVGPEGHVYAHTTDGAVKRWNGNPMDKRVERFGISNIESIVTEAMAEPELPGDLDAVFMIMTYHDAVWSGTDRSVLNASVLAALKPGGMFGVIDHHAGIGHGTDDCHSLHRIEKQALIDEVVAAGFELESESDCLENPDDPCELMVHEKDIRGRTSRFCLKFRKPSA
jgi:predicted methyltransferase